LAALPTSSPSPRCRQPCTTSQARPKCMTAATPNIHQAESATLGKPMTRSCAPHGELHCLQDTYTSTNNGLWLRFLLQA
jgi:hypothetical protein